MKYRILCVGKMKDQFYKAEIENYCEKVRLKGHQLEVIEFPDEKIPEHLNEKIKNQILEKECERMRAKISNRDYVIALCIEGKEITSRQHQEYLEHAIENGCEGIVYLIGGSLGLSDTIKHRANLKMSFSKMTFPHQMMRMVLCEEIYQCVRS